VIGKQFPKRIANCKMTIAKCKLEDGNSNNLHFAIRNSQFAISCRYRGRGTRTGESMQYSDYLIELRATDAKLASTLGEITCLEKLLSWIQVSGLPLANIEVLAQDEYSHDMLIPLLDNRWLVFGMS
jgi:hypothetical protein